MKKDRELKPRGALQPLVSIIVPVFNEEDSISVFFDKTSKILESAGLSFEVIFVNDGSSDKTFEKLIEYSSKDKRIKIINFSRNFGKEAALTAGLEYADGDVLVPMDVDLQDPPELIPRFIDRWQEGYDVVYGMRTSRDSDTISKQLTANWFYRVFNMISKIKIPENAGDFRLLDRRVVNVLLKLPERNRFMKGLFSWAGYNSVGVPYERPEREKGETKWNYWRLWNFALDGIVSFSSLPLRVWSYIGAIVAFISFLYGTFIIFKVVVFGIDVPGYASLLSVILFLGGIQILSIGILGEYLARIFVEVKSRPIYIVENIYQSGEVTTNDKQKEI